VAYILDEAGDFATRRCNKAMVGLDPVQPGEEADFLKATIARHRDYTQSELAQDILDNWDATLPKFIKVMPKDYKRVLDALAKAQAEGLTGEEAINAAFEANSRDLSRVGGN
jgi:glutamate synthase (ferredoxin)